jgi:hypothetical protein
VKAFASLIFRVAFTLGAKTQGPIRPRAAGHRNTVCWISRYRQDTDVGLRETKFVQSGEPIGRLVATDKADRSTLVGFRLARLSIRTPRLVVKKKLRRTFQLVLSSAL